MNSTVMAGNGRVIAQPREQQLNEAIFKVGVTADVERYLKVVDELVVQPAKGFITRPLGSN